MLRPGDTRGARPVRGSRCVYRLRHRPGSRPGARGCLGLRNPVLRAPGRLRVRDLAGDHRGRGPRERGPGPRDPDGARDPASGPGIESPRVRADIIEATEFPDLVARYAVRGVPRTIVDDRVAVEGAVPEPNLLDAVLQAAGGRGESA
ncbi:MAG: thioredoxin family protein [Bacillati bacterium ANGP1]|uniref:Thioredoxin family protein n=1 Tax=Candidatus Segetimicrobium genomatis TaxID=2569760 RepID=A0A537J2D1_9BACT|nr:MAG: thioredoxin family protein [Terrabacteria group bacterium ANGP1]